MTEAAFQATYAEWKVIKTRACVQLVFEIPIEQADAAYQVLGGMPIAAKEVWCGIARLEQPVSRPVSQAEKQPGSEIGPQPSPVRVDKPKRSIAQRAGMLCNDTLFHAFLRERFTNEWHDSLAQSGGPAAVVSQVAAQVVRKVCNVASRRDINEANTEWHALQLAYELWVSVPDMVPA